MTQKGITDICLLNAASVISHTDQIKPAAAYLYTDGIGTRIDGIV